MIHFVPMNENEFTEYWKYSVESWSRDMKKAGLLAENTSYKDADARVRKFIPEGIKTPGHYFMHIIVGERKIGKIWVEVRGDGDCGAYVWDIMITEEFRGKGYGTEAMKLIENFVAGKGATRISLNVFSYNEVARKLYRKCGYSDAAITMIKHL